MHTQSGATASNPVTKNLPAGLAACRRIVGGEADPFAHEWDTLPESERVFWLGVSRQDRFLSTKPWRELSGDARCRIKNGLFRAASRASVLLAAGAGQ